MDFVEEICYAHETYKGYEYVIYYAEHSIMAHLCGYVKIPKDHPWYKLGIKQRWFSLGASTKALAKLTAKSANPYIAPPATKTVSRRHYHRDYDSVPLNVHGGLTFGEYISSRTNFSYFQPFTPGLWVGWDYQHAGDEMYLPADRIIEKDQRTQDVWTDIMAIHRREFPGIPKDIRWNWEDVEVDCKDAIEQLRRAKNPYLQVLWTIKDFLQQTAATIYRLFGLQGNRHDDLRTVH